MFHKKIYNEIEQIKRKLSLSNDDLCKIGDHKNTVRFSFYGNHQPDFHSLQTVMVRVMARFNAIESRIEMLEKYLKIELSPETAIPSQYKRRSK